ncbi:heavy metal-responsive transcriptional regulator [Zavarzinella formosa]|uniref:heavy metal-responsive transcriptional regulator n=1 Tax=Zavarzinella formosa TaxID=360055 RepID=UPI0002EC1413|nr:heavy metal-responsive transcriptional regulator [Zavarzinella formosa]
MKSMTIGQVARRPGIGIETIRFYEREGLLPAPERKRSGYRVFFEDILIRLRFIRRAKELGFSLREIMELLKLTEDPESTRGDVKRQTETKLADIEAKIIDLQRMRKTLRKLVNECPGHGSLTGCPTMESLNHDPVAPKENKS